MPSYYQGLFTPEHPEKYKGDPTKIVFRSSWERSVARWCDSNPNVRAWSSEETVVPYVCATDGKWHRYFVDFHIEFTSGVVLLVEVKPRAQTVPPVNKKGKRRDRLMEETATFAKNVSKWEAADKYCNDRGWRFVVWTEDTLAKMGINTNVGGKFFASKRKP